MNRLEQMYARIEKRKITQPKENKTILKAQIKNWEQIAVKFQACADLTLLKAKILKEKL